MSDAQVKGTTRTKVAGQPKTQDQVRVLYGVHSLDADLADRTVADVRQALRQALNISPQAVALVDGREVEEGVILLAGQQLEFVRLAGEKGRSRPFSQFMPIFVISSPLYLRNFAHSSLLQGVSRTSDDSQIAWPLFR